MGITSASAMSSGQHNNAALGGTTDAASGNTESASPATSST